MLAAFLASSEARRIILAVGSIRGWRDALLGTAAALAVLLSLVDVLVTALTRVPLDIIQVIGPVGPRAFRAK
jgi:uncharacterized membrane protein